MKKLIVFTAVAILVAVPGFAQKKGGGGGSNASNKAVFSTNSGGVIYTKYDATLDCGTTGFHQPNDKLCTPWYTLFNLPDALKTSTKGALEVVVSMECSLQTDSEAAAMIGDSGSGGSRAGIEVRVYVDGYEMAPGPIVYCDRLQYTKLTIPELLAQTSPMPVAVTSVDPFVWRLFQRTKSAHAYHYYLPTPNVELHDIFVEVRGIVQCFKDGVNVTCWDSGIDIPKFIDGPDGNLDGGTKAAIGYATIVVEEHNNWAEFEPLP